MIEMTFEEATVESLEDAAVIMAVGVGDRHMSNVLVGRKEFARVAGNPALVAETKIVRVKVEGEELVVDVADPIGVANALEKLHGPPAHLQSGKVAAKCFAEAHGLQALAAELERAPSFTTEPADRSQRRGRRGQR